MENTNSYPSEVKSANRTGALMRNVYLYMTGALIITGLISFAIGTNPSLLHTLIPSKGALYAWIIGELAIVMGLSFMMNKMSAVMAFCGFLLYAAVNGVTLSLIFMVYELGTLATTFFITAGLFATMAVIGTITKKDLTKMGGILMQLLIGLIIASVVNLLLKNEMLDYIISCAGVAIFTGLTAYDAWKIRKWNDEMGEDADQETFRKLCVIGALSLYLDFINIFLFLLRIFGRER